MPLSAQQNMQVGLNYSACWTKFTRLPTRFRLDTLRGFSIAAVSTTCHSFTSDYWARPSTRNDPWTHQH